MYNGFVESQERVDARLARINAAGDVEAMKAITASGVLDDRTEEWKAAHDMTDLRNQLPTEAERQDYSAARLDAEAQKAIDGLQELSEKLRSGEYVIIQGKLPVTTAPNLLQRWVANPIRAILSIYGAVFVIVYVIFQALT